MTKCKIDVHLYPDNSGRNTGWEYLLLRKLEKNICVGDYGNHRIKR